MRQMHPRDCALLRRGIPCGAGSLHVMAGHSRCGYHACGKTDISQRARQFWRRADSLRFIECCKGGVQGPELVIAEIPKKRKHFVRAARLQRLFAFDWRIGRTDPHGSSMDLCSDGPG